MSKKFIKIVEKFRTIRPKSNRVGATADIGVTSNFATRK